MKSKVGKSVTVGTIGAMLSGISLYGMNPLGMAAYGALAGSNLSAVPAIPLFFIALYYGYGAIVACKYIAAMFICSTFVSMLKKVSANEKNNVKKLNVYITALATLSAYGLLECADAFMDNRQIDFYIVIAITMLLVFSLTVVFAKVVEIFLGEDRYGMVEKVKRKHLQQNKNECIVGNYEGKMRQMAEAFEKMSKSIHAISSVSESELVLSGEAKVVNDIWKYRLEQSREAVAMQLQEMAAMFKDFTSDSYVFANMPTEQERCLYNRLKEKGVLMKNVVVLNNKRGIDEVNIMMRAPKKSVSLKEVAVIISEVFEKNVEFQKNSYAAVSKEYQTYTFVEEPNFFILHGAARHSKEKMEVCGDNFTCLELKSGQALLTVSDGMGHGFHANRESEMVVELLEEMMAGGFSEETAVKLINSIFLVDSDIANPAALDMGVIDMYSGICDFMKLGAASTFVKRGNWVEVIKSTSLPLGSTKKADIETATKKLYDGDFVIMMSDGIIDAIQEENKEKIISDIILGLKEGKPKDMADEILEKALIHADGERDDDMMVLVTGIWNKCTV